MEDRPQTTGPQATREVHEALPSLAVAKSSSRTCGVTLQRLSFPALWVLSGQ